jgi:hypothetical protein
MAAYYSRRQKLIKCDMAQMKRLPSGRFKAVVCGVPAYHMMDWNGCNFHYVTLPDQPFRGFKTPQECLEWLFEKYPTQKQAVDAGTALQSQGTWFDGNGMLDVDYEKKQANERVEMDKHNGHGRIVVYPLKP